jgi:hypothetical protein
MSEVRESVSDPWRLSERTLASELWDSNMHLNTTRLLHQPLQVIGVYRVALGHEDWRTATHLSRDCSFSPDFLDLAIVDGDAALRPIGLPL